MFVPMNSLQAPLVSEVLHENEAMLSILSVALAAGMMCAVVIYPYVAKVLSAKPMIFICGLVFGSYYILLVIIGKYIGYTGLKYLLVMCSSFVAGAIVSLLSTYINATFLKIVEQEYIARTAAIMNSAGASAIPVTSFIVSIASANCSTGIIFVITGVLLIVCMGMIAMVFSGDEAGGETAQYSNQI